MVNTKWFAFFVFIYIIGMYMGASFEKHIGSAWSGTGEVTTLEYLTNFSNLVVMNAEVGSLSFPMPNPQYFSALLKVMTFNFEFLQGTGYSMIYQIILTPFAVIGIVSLLGLTYQLVRGILPW
jgi:hypothetical protein